MKIDKVINKLSARIYNLLDSEKKVNDFTTEKLRELAIEILEDSYKKARDNAGLGIVGSSIDIAAMLLGTAFSKPRVVDRAIDEEKEATKKQYQIDRKWHDARKRLDLCSASTLYQIIRFNRTQTFDDIISFILNQ